MKNVHLLGDDGVRVQTVDRLQEGIHYRQHVADCFNLVRDGGIAPNKVEIREDFLEIKKLSFMFEIPRGEEDRKIALDNMINPFPNKELLDYSKVVHADGATFFRAEFNYAVIKDSVIHTVVDSLESEIRIKNTSIERSQLECKMYRDERDEKHKANTVLNGRLLGIETRDSKPSFSFVMLIIKNYLKNIFSVN